jgi:[ribosomal protein S5]-alanine N-acetyltransferase
VPATRAAAGTSIRPLVPGDAAELGALIDANRGYLRPWFPAAAMVPASVADRRARLEHDAAQREAGRRAPYAILDAGGAIVGTITLSEIVRGAFQNAYVGYWVAESRAGAGHATRAVRLAVAEAFGPLGLHRAQANVMPSNGASMRVLEKAGFRREGLALAYLEIAGHWEDHVMLALTRDG